MVAEVRIVIAARGVEAKNEAQKLVLTDRIVKADAKMNPTEMIVTTAAEMIVTTVEIMILIVILIEGVTGRSRRITSATITAP